ncbi:hypothetical protein D3C74_287530 [compost metagenome]
MDSLFTHASLIQVMLDRGLNVIGAVKVDKKRYLVGGRRLSLQELYLEDAPVQTKERGILRSIRTELSLGIPVTMVFVRLRSNKKEWLAIQCTDRSIPEEEIIRIYGIRWNIEVFFKCAKILTASAKGIPRPFIRFACQSHHNRFFSLHFIGMETPTKHRPMHIGRLVSLAL